MFVVDASVVLAWCFDDESSPAAEAAVDRLILEGGIAPAHWPLEIANAVRVAERRKRVDSDGIRTLTSMVAGLPIDIAPVELGTALGLIETARQHDLSVYDAAYLNLARARGLPLATVDGRLADACRAAGVPLIAA
ncbi:MAG: type II toxin-antitoxin system VapC family toxin [Candidatus Limnocylindrales bacterium]